MKKVDITFLPSTKGNYFDDPLIIDWCNKLKDTLDGAIGRHEEELSLIHI